MYYTVYKTTNNLNNKIYIGKHKTKNLDDSYMGSGTHFKKALNKYGEENFRKKILFLLDSYQDMNAKEKEIVNSEFVAKKDNYNLKEGGEGGWDYVNNSPEIREKIRIALNTPECREKRAKITKEQWQDQEFREKMIAQMIERWQDEEYRAEMSKQSLTNWQNEEYIAKTTQAMNTPEALAKNSEAQKESYLNNPERATKHSKFMTEKWQDEEYKTEQSKLRKERYQNDPEARVINSEAQKEHYKNNPERAEKQSEVMKNKIWINNGNKEKRINSNEQIPDGWSKGKIKGKIWINNGIDEKKTLNDEQHIPGGWQRGRAPRRNKEKLK